LILVAAYIDHDGEVGRYVLSQDKRRDDDDEPEIVYYKRNNYRLEQVGRVQFALE